MDAYQNYWMLDFKEAIKVEKQLLNQRNPYSISKTSHAT